MLQNIAQNGQELTVQQPEVTPEVDARSFDVTEDSLTLLELEKTGDLFVQTEESEIFEVSFSQAGTMLLPTQQSPEDLKVLEVASRNKDNVNTDTTAETEEVVVMD